MMNVALILSGGTGSRIKTEVPKQYLEVQGKMVISWCIETFERHREIDAVQIVAAENWWERVRDCVGEKFRGFSRPGETRQLSIVNGLRDICGYAGGEDRVIIHDAARPLVSSGLISRCLRASTAHDGVVPVLPIKDTVYISENGEKISSLLNRSHLFAGQAPESFSLGPYMEANERLLPEKILAINGSAEPAVLAGMDIALIEGEEINFKLTTEEELLRLKQILKKETK